MRQTKLFLISLLSIVGFAACSVEDTADMFNNPMGEMPSDFNGGGGNGTITAASGELSTFDISIDRTTKEPETTIAATYPEATDNISKRTFGTIISIDMSNPADATEMGVTITNKDGHVTANHADVEGVCYMVTGATANGSLTIKGNTDYELMLNGTEITNPASVAINLDSKMGAYIVLSGHNKLTDGAGDNDSHKSALYSKGKMLFSGDGILDIYGVYNNGIHSKSYLVFDKGVNLYIEAANHGIKASGDIIINGGIINVSTAGAGAKGINGDENIIINGGRTTTLCTGNGEWDDEDQETKASAGLACELTMTINGGEVYSKATGSGGKGLKADYEAYINGGKVRAITEGGLYYCDGKTENHNYRGNTDNLDDAYTSSPKGIKVGTKNVHGLLNITGGDVMVRTSGYNGEGIESKGTLEISGGSVMVAAYDDAINSSSDLTISGGTVIAVGTNNDGIDANGNLYIKGGNIIAFGASGAEAGIDSDESHAFYISGGSLFAIGGRIDTRLGSTSQGLIQISGSVQANSAVTLSNGSSTVATFTMPPYSNTNGTILITDPGLTSGNSYTLKLGSTSKDVTATSSISSFGGGGMGGGFPGW
ncbi:MAG: carbohydrate-binding domain-containing protein [Prevotella sp.]|nr:carbohydrate-binding domain-containing protein [Prevotella sp.]